MCSYNAVNGQPTCASQFLTDIIRGKWNFSGYITSDTGALEDVYREHKYVATEQEAACVSLINGTTDVDSGAVYHDSLLGCPKEAINAALRRTFRLKFELGLFDPIDSSPYWSTPLSSIATPAAAALNALATRESMVVLKNTRGAPGALPWARGMKVAVLGPHANATTALVGNYLGQLCPDDGFDCLDSPFSAIRALNVGGSTTLGEGPGLTTNSSKAWAEALALGRQADAIVLVLGIDGTIEGESNDRVDIDLPAVQHAFAAAVGALGKPTVLFLVHGGSLDTSPELANPAIAAIVDAFYPGFVGARAMADTLFGENANCCGKMPITTYAAGYVEEIKMSDMEVDSGVGRGYRFYGGEVVYPFGFGLGLTTFSLSPAAPLPPNTTALPAEATPSTSLLYSLTLKNTGTVAGDDVLQAYFLPRSTPSQPASKLRRQLFGYQRVHLGPAESATVTFKVDTSTLRLSDRATGNLVSTPGQFDLLFTNGADLQVGASVAVTGTEVLVAEFPY
jgi:beta-D-xylosidase 4